MVFSISFIEAWVKFRAKLVTRKIGLDVGAHVFSVWQFLSHYNALHLA